MPFVKLPLLSGVAGLTVLGAASFAATLFAMRPPPEPALALAGPASSSSPAASAAVAIDAIEPSAPPVAAPPAADAPAARPTDDPLQRVLVRLKASDSTERAQALDELRRFEAETTLPVYGRVLANESDPKIRLEALEGLAQLRQDPRWRVAAENELRSRLDDGDEEVVARIRERLESPAPASE